jgi:hypothetical protein
VGHVGSIELRTIGQEEALGCPRALIDIAISRQESPLGQADIVSSDYLDLPKKMQANRAMVRG